MKLTYAAKDARDFDNALKGQKGVYYVDVKTRVLTDREVTRSSIIDGLAVRYHHPSRATLNDTLF